MPLFVFEGPDGVGKTTITSAVAKRIEQAGHLCARVSFPGTEPGTIGQHIYKLHHAPCDYDIAQLSPLSLQLLHVAAHVDAIERRILPLIENDTTVLLDRYWWSTWAYGISNGIEEAQLEAVLAVERLVWHGVLPTTLFLLSRTQVFTTPHLNDAYQALAKRESAIYSVLQTPNDHALDDVVEQVTRVLISRI